MVTPDLKALRRKILSGPTTPAHPARVTPPSVPSPDFIPHTQPPPAAIEPPSIFARADHWLDSAYHNHGTAIALLGTALGFGVGLHNATTAPSFGAAWTQVFTATIAGFLLTGLAAGALYHVAKKIIQFRHAIAALALLILAANLLQAWKS